MTGSGIEEYSSESTARLRVEEEAYFARTRARDWYVSFGQVHSHVFNASQKFDKDTIAVIRAESYDEAHEKAMRLFDRQFCFVYEQMPDMSYYPKGLVRVVI